MKKRTEKRALHLKISGDDNRKIVIEGKDASDSDQLYDAAEVIYSDTVYRPELLNSVMVPPEVYRSYHGTVVSLVSLHNSRTVDVRLLADPALNGNLIKTSSYIKDALNLQKDSALYLCKHRSIDIEKVTIQRIDDIKEDTVTLSAEIYDDYIKNSNYSLYQFIEVYSGRSFVLKASHIKRATDGDESNGQTDRTISRTVKMNRKQRQFLGLIVPPFLNEEQRHILTDHKRLLPAEIALIQRAYPEKDGKKVSGGKKGTKRAGEYILNEAEIDHEDRKIIEELVKTYLTDLKIVPVIQSFCYKKPLRPLRALADFYVGKSTLSLACRRPYENDENSDIVRISRSNMRLLGIDEMDKVILKYKNNEVICRALEIDDVDHFTRNNKPLNADLSVGVPAHIRKKLGVPDLLSCVKIDRYTPFIFKKSVNEQILPVILTLFSSEVLAWQNIALSICLPLLAIPIVVYINLSSKRNMHA